MKKMSLTIVVDVEVEDALAESTICDISKVEPTVLEVVCKDPRVVVKEVMIARLL